MIFACAIFGNIYVNDLPTSEYPQCFCDQSDYIEEEEEGPCNNYWCPCNSNNPDYLEPREE